MEQLILLLHQATDRSHGRYRFLGSEKLSVSLRLPHSITRERCREQPLAWQRHSDDAAKLILSLVQSAIFKKHITSDTMY